MDFLKIIGHLETADLDQVSPRRKAIKTSAALAASLALAPLALTIGSTGTASAQSQSANITDTLNLLLVVEYLQLSFYTKGIDAPNLIPGADLPAIKQIQADQLHHIAFLKKLIGAQAIAPPVFEFNPGGTPYSAYASAFTYYVRFLNIAFTFEDLGNRIYQGCIRELNGQPALQKDLFSIHSVEARHSSHFRYLFSKVRAGGSEAPWVQPPYNADTNYSFVVPMYYDEENTTQLSFSAAEGAFDEFMKPIDAKKILNVFLISPRYA